MKKKNCCVDCGKIISFYAKRCSDCYHKTKMGENNPMYGKENKWGKHTKESCQKIKTSKIKWAQKLNKNFLIQQYIDLKKTMKEISKNVGCGLKTVERYLIKHKIPIKTTSEALKGKYIGDKNPNYGNHKIAGENHFNWQGGISKDGYSYKFNNKLKQKIRKRDNYTCQICGITEEEHIIVYGRNLDVHHIDYDKQNCSEDDLTSLCIPCHMRTNFNRKYWKQHFQIKQGVKHAKP